MSNPILDMLANELADASEDLKKSLVKLAKAVTNVDRLTDEQVQRLGEHTMHEALESANSSEAMHAAYDEGYMQACEDLHTKLTAYYKGLN